MNMIKHLPYSIRGKVDVLLYLPFSSKIERSILNERLRHRLIDVLKDDINRMREYTGRDFEDWWV